MVFQKVLREPSAGRRGGMAIPFILQTLFFTNKETGYHWFNSVLFRLLVIAGRDRVIECSNTVNKIVCSTIAEYAASRYIRHSCTNRGVGTSKTSRFSASCPHTHQAGHSQEKEAEVPSCQTNGKHENITALQCCWSFHLRWCYVQYLSSLYLLKEFLCSFSFEHVTENATCNSAKSLCTWRFVI